MFEEGFQNIINIDFSPTLVRIMQEKNKNKDATFKCIILISDEQMDCRNMKEFYNGQFDCVIDKGTLDTIYVNLIK